MQADMSQGMQAVVEGDPDLFGQQPCTGLERKYHQASKVLLSLTAFRLVLNTLDLPPPWREISCAAPMPLSDHLPGCCSVPRSMQVCITPHTWEQIRSTGNVDMLRRALVPAEWTFRTSVQMRHTLAIHCICCRHMFAKRKLGSNDCNLIAE